jgi:CHAT domain-containing protein/Tfp pilus assembly protein PilF
MLLAGWSFAAAPPALLTAEQGKVVLQRNALLQQGQEAWKLGKQAEAVALLQRAQDLELGLVGPWHRATESTADLLAYWEEKRQRWHQAEGHSRRVLEARQHLDGPEHWRTVDARLDLEYTRRLARLARLDAGQLQQLRQADQWHGQVFRLGQQGRSKEALPLAQKVLAVRRALVGEWHRLTALGWLNLGSEQAALNRVEQARRSYEQARLIFKKALGEKHPLYATSLNNLGNLYQTMGDYQAALPLLQLALQVYKAALGKHPDYARSLHNLATLYKDMGDHQAALPLLQQALRIWKEALGEKHPLYAHGLNSLAVLYQVMGDHQAALPLFQQALRLRKEALGEKHPLYAMSLNNLAALYKDMGDHQAALPMFQHALQIFKETQGEKHPDYAGTLNKLGQLYLDMGNHEAALPLHQQALRIYKEALGEKHPEYATCLNSLAGLHQTIGDHQAALPLYQQALRIYKEALGEKHPHYASSLHNLAMLYQALGDHQAALPLYQQALQVSKEALGEKHPEYATCLHNLASLCTDMGNHKAALPLYQQAVQVREAALGKKHPDRALSLNSLALLYYTRGEYQAALPLSQQSLQIIKEALGQKHPYYARSLHNLGMLYSAMGDHKAALPLFQQALQTCKDTLGQKHPYYATTLTRLALLYQGLKQPNQARRLCDQALALTRSHLLLAASVQSERQQLAAARDVRHRLDMRLSLPDPDKRGAAASHQHVLTWKGAVFVQQQQRRAFAHLLGADSRAEVRELVEQLQQTTRLLAALILAPVEPRTASSRRQEAEKLTQQKEELEGRLSRLSRTFHVQHKQAEVGAANLEQMLPADAALVDFLFYSQYDHSHNDPRKRHQRRLSAWVVRPGRALVRVDLGPAEPIEQAVAAFRQTLKRRSAAGAAGRSLHKVLWQPLAEHLKGATTVLLSPDGVLGTVPFAALPGSKEGSYLIEDVALALVPVPQLLPELLAPVPKEKRLKPSLLVVGDVNFDSTPTAVASAGDRSGPRGGLKSWGKLEATSAEADAVKGSFSRLFKGAALSDLRKDQARKTAVRQALVKSRYAHLATHGFFAPPELKSALGDNRPEDRAGLFGQEGVTGWHPLLLSGLVLAGANKEAKPGDEDGILTALEVSEMELAGLELAVLSACETGLGKQAGGEGLLGLQRAFAVAGCRSVLASLWKVDDQATQALMAAFYRTWWGKKGISCALALRQAQLAMLRDGIEGMAREGSRGEVREPLPARDKRKRLPPFFWAAFVLSGDWR